MAKPHQSVAILSMALFVQFGGAPAAVPSALAAQTWRCGNTYTDQPCTGGKAVDVDDTRSPGAARETDAQTRRAAVAADRMERDRHRQEQIASRQQPTVIENMARAPTVVQPQSTASIGKGKKKKGAKEPEFFTAHDTQTALTTRKKKSAGAAAD